MATLPGADIRGYYTALRVELPAWAQLNATVRCFADPDAHQHGDRTPSCSVDLQTGAFCCHGCGAHGGAYDAALATGHTPRQAIDLMITHGLTERRQPSVGLLSATRAPAPALTPSTPAAARSAIAPLVCEGRTVDEQLLSVWRRDLHEHRRLIERLITRRGWREQDLDELHVGLHRGRLAIPIYRIDGSLQGVLRYQPFARAGEPKTIAIRGSRLGLIPHPARTSTRELVLCEGPADMLAARARGLPAVAMPSASAWRSEWAELLHGREVTVAMDADDAGRRAARAIAHDLAGVHVIVHALELAPHRDDGYDLTDWLTAHRHQRMTLALLRTFTLPLRATQQPARASATPSIPASSSGSPLVAHSAVPTLGQPRPTV